MTSQIRQLEDVLALPLIDRSNPRKPSITPEGRKVLEYADSIFESSRELLNWATKGALPKDRVVRIGALSGLSRNLQYEFMTPLIGKEEVRFEVVTGDQRNLLALLSNHELDVVLSSHTPGEGWHARVLTSSPLVFVCARGVRLRRGATLRERIRGRDLFVPGPDFEAKPELEEFLEDLRPDFRLAGEIDDIALLRILAIRSGAVVAIPRLGVQNDLERGDLQVLGSVPAIRQKFYAISQQRLNPSIEVRLLMDAVRAGGGEPVKKRASR
ncbi:MAG: LysR family transcriptional regulator [Proteobacteria bacterium]|nr:LysR family transcriptional regulator [Pseudomonadota bacterium]